MSTDPSWLYSTIAQSSAAIVAIVGGFMTATVLMLISEKRNLNNQLNGKAARLKGIDEVLEKNKKDFGMPTLQDYTHIAEKSFLEREISELESRIRDFSYPPHLGWGLRILFLFALTSIVLPIAVIMTEAFYPVLKWLVFILFSVGLATVLVYIGYQIQGLRRK